MQNRNSTGWQSVCCLFHRRTYGLQGRCFTKTFSYKSHKKLFCVGRERKTATKRQLVPLFSICSACARKLKVDRGNFETFQPILEQKGWTQCQSVPTGPHEKYSSFLGLIILFYDVDIVNGNIMGDFATRIVQKHDNTVRLMRNSKNICFVSKINAVFQSFRCPKFDTFFYRSTQFVAPFNYMQWTSEKILPQERN